MRLPELLSPAGSYDAAKAAVEAGCDAVYFGGGEFNARHSAENVGEADIPALIDFCHLRGVKTYITVNTVLYNDELPRALLFMEKCREWGADAFIIQDLGLASLARKRFPDVALHASTQLTTKTAADAAELKLLGFSRVILSREITLAEAAKIREETGIDIEVFIHGAMCVSFSGQCLMSGFIGKRSGNRGKCAQPCRKRYKLEAGGWGQSRAGNSAGADGYLISMKDLNSLDHLREYVDTGAAALKIEGRMKNAAYAYYVTKAYRERINQISEGKDFEETDAVRRARAVYARGGFTDGYREKHSSPGHICPETPGSTGAYVGKVLGYDVKRGVCRLAAETELVPGDGIEVFTKAEPHAGAYVNCSARPGDIAAVSIIGDISAGDRVYKSYDKRLMNDAKRLIGEDTRKLSVSAEILLKIGCPARLTLNYGDISVTKEGETFARAENAPVTEGAVRFRLSKTGATTFSIAFSRVDMDEGGFIAVSALNELRRGAADALAAAITQRAKRAPVPFAWHLCPPGKSERQLITAHVRSGAQLEAALSSGAVRVVYADASPKLINDFSKTRALCENGGVNLFVALPPENDAMVPEYLRLDADGFLAQSPGVLRLARKTGKAAAADYTLNVVNQAAYFAVSELAGTVCLSAEANVNAVIECAGPGTEVIAYGMLPLMTTRACPIGIHAADKGDGKHCRMMGAAPCFSLKDQMGVKFPIITRCGACEAQILNSRPVCMLSRLESLRGAGLIRLNFTIETPARVYDVCRAFGGDPEAEARITAALAEEGFTYGWFFSEG
jgi:putative protease